MVQPIMVAGTFADLERAVREICRQIDLLASMFQRRRTVPTLIWRWSTSGACTGVLISVRLP